MRSASAGASLSSRESACLWKCEKTFDTLWLTTESLEKLTQSLALLVRDNGSMTRVFTA